MNQRDAERLACTNDDNVMDVLNDIDASCERVDVIDDYVSEKKQVLDVQRRGFKYTYGSHIARLLLGPVYQKYDDMDEHKIMIDAHGHFIGTQKSLARHGRNVHAPILTPISIYGNSAPVPTPNWIDHQIGQPGQSYGSSNLQKKKKKGGKCVIC